MIFYFNMAQAQVTARQNAFSGAGGLSSTSVDGLFYNPASLSLDADLSFGLGHGEGQVGLSESTSAPYREHFAWVKDSILSSFRTKRNAKVRKALKRSDGMPLAASIVYRDLKIGEVQDKTWTLGLSHVFWRRWAWGLSLHYSDLERRSQNTRSSAWSGDLGVMHWLTRKWALGFSGLSLFHDFEEQETDLSLKSEPRYRLSALYRASKLVSFHIDAEKRKESKGIEEDYAFGGGFEARTNPYITFIFSAFRTYTEASLDYGFGVNFTGPKLQISYGLRHSDLNSATKHVVDLKMPLW